MCYGIKYARFKFALTQPFFIERAGNRDNLRGLAQLASRRGRESHVYTRVCIQENIPYNSLSPRAMLTRLSVTRRLPSTLYHEDNYRETKALVPLDDGLYRDHER